MDAIRQRMLEKFAQRVAEKGIGEFAPGIPSRKQKSAIPRVARFGKPVTWWYTDHRHAAVRAGLHTDLRLSDGYKAYSWAVRKGIPKTPGEKVLAIRQPDHCFPPGTLISTPTGPRPIEDIRVGDVVYSVDCDGNRVERRVTATMQHPVDGLVSFHVRLGRNGGTVLSTHGHEIYTTSGKTQAADLVGSDRPSMVGRRLSRDQLSVVMGTLLGDGSAGDGRLRISHSTKQRDYADYLASTLESKVVPDKGGAFWVCKHGQDIAELSRRLYSNGRKILTEWWLDEMGPRGLAILFCDDGSCWVSENHPYVELSLQSFDIYDIELFRFWLYDRFGIESSIYDAGRDTRWGDYPPLDEPRKRLRIHLTGAVQRFFTLISPYIPSAMSYKVPGEGSFDLATCESCGQLTQKKRRFCSRCLWDDAKGAKPGAYRPPEGLVWSHAVYERFGCWPVGEYLDGDEPLGWVSFFASLDVGAKEVCSPSEFGVIPGRVRRIPKTISYSGDAHNLTVEGEHNYILACGLVVGNSTAYMSFEGQISSGYGKTKGRGVWVAEQGPVRIIQANPQKIRFTVIKSQNPRQYTMIHQGGDKWLLINTTPTVKTRPGVPQSKPKYREAQPESFERFVTNGAKSAIMSKIDGSNASFNFDKESPEVYSHRPSERKTGLIDHTYVAGLERVKTPKALRGARVRGELYAVDKSERTIPNRELAGILNSSPMKGKNTLDAKNLKLRLGVFDVISAPGGKDMSSASWGEKHKVLKQVVRSMKGHGFRIPDTAFTAGQQRKLFNRILKGEHPETSEGVVVWQENQAAPPTKIKFRPHHQVFVHTVYEGRGPTNRGTMGRYSYSLTPGGAPVGFVGTGFNREQSDWLWKNRKKLKGRKVVIKSMEQFPSGAFRAPSHSHIHL